MFGKPADVANDARSMEQRFRILVEGVRQNGLTDAVAELEGWISATSDLRLQAEMAKLLGFFWLRRNDPARSIAWTDQAFARMPEDRDCAYNAVFARFQIGRFDEAASRAKAAIAAFGEDFAFYGILSTTLGALGRPDEARAYGMRALELKNLTVTGTARDLSGVPVRDFNPAAPARNIISFSLFGALKKYTDGAVLNARAAPFLYPGWTCRFYVDDSVPQPVLQALMQAGAQVLHVGGLPRDRYGTLWRFLVAEDTQVDRYLLRDADSLLNTRERGAVEEWLISGRHFHVMRDNLDHAELVLAGMWGGVRGALPPLLPVIHAWFTSQKSWLDRTYDQMFLREALWPTIRQSVLTHDSQFAFGERRNFPIYGQLLPGCWVGCLWTQMLASDVASKILGFPVSAS